MNWYDYAAKQHQAKQPIICSCSQDMVKKRADDGDWGYICFQHKWPCCYLPPSKWKGGGRWVPVSYLEEVLKDQQAGKR